MQIKFQPPPIPQERLSTIKLQLCTHHPTQDRNRHKYHRLQGAITYTDEKNKLQPQEIIVNANKVEANTTMTMNATARQEGIRGDVDICLDAVAAVLQQRRDVQRRKEEIKEGEDSGPFINDDAIHRIDNGIVMKYIQTVYEDYGIHNKFGNLLNNTEFEPNNKAEIYKYQSVERSRRSSRKQFLSVTQPSIRARDHSQSRREVSNQNKMDNHSVFKNDRQINYHEHLHTVHRHTKSNVSQPKQNQKIGEQYSYCVNCQQKLLKHNANFHEQYECSNFKLLYEMNFEELKQLVHVKIVRIQMELDELVKEREDNEGVGRSSRVVQSMRGYLKSVREVDRTGGNYGQSNHYDEFKTSLNNNYSKAVNLTHKLHSFTQIYDRLRQQSSKQLSNPPNQLLKTLRVATTTTPRSNHAMVGTPIHYLEPQRHYPYTSQFV